jgi:hypothetical protein
VKTAKKHDEGKSGYSWYEQPDQPAVADENLAGGTSHL